MNEATGNLNLGRDGTNGEAVRTSTWVAGCGRPWPEEWDEQGQVEYGAVTVAREREERPDFQPTTSFLQRRLRWGYVRASRLIERIKLRSHEMKPATTEQMKNPKP